ncbi:MAG: DUF5647 family protein [Candidatus Binatia bacterium]
MKKDSVVKKNLDLLDEFMKYAFDHPDILEEVPRNASLVILPEGNPSLQKENRKMLNKLKARGEQVVVLKLRATKRKISRIG